MIVVGARNRVPSGSKALKVIGHVRSVVFHRVALLLAPTTLSTRDAVFGPHRVLHSILCRHRFL